MTKLKLIFPGVLRDLREAHGLSLAAMADRMQTSKTRAHEIEQEGANLEEATVARAAEALGYDSIPRMLAAWRSVHFAHFGKPHFPEGPADCPGCATARRNELAKAMTDQRGIAKPKRPRKPRKAATKVPTPADTTHEAPASWRPPAAPASIEVLPADPPADPPPSWRPSWRK